MKQVRTLAAVSCAVLLLPACAGKTPGPQEPQVIAGNVCSGVRPLGPDSLGPAGTASASSGVLALLTDAERPGTAQELVLVELATHRVRWRKPLQASARPEILQDVVVVAGADQTLVAFDLRTGAERFRRELGRPLLLGAAQSGKTLLFTSSAASWDPRLRGSSLFALDADSGSLRWKREVPFALSRPVVRGSRALVISDHADLWTLDLDSGDDTGCGPLGGNSVEWLESDGEQVFFGAAEARLLGADARERGPALELPRADLPGRPFFRGSSYQPLPATRSAHGRVSVLAPLSTHDGKLGADPFYFVFYRDVFGFRADGTLAWAQLLPADVARAQASVAGLWLVDEAGGLTMFDAGSGAPLARTALELGGLRVASADVQPGAAAASSGSRPQPTAAVELQAGLKRVAADPDARLLPARSLAVDELARLDTDQASADLLEVYSAPNTPGLLQARIAKRLAERTRGAEHLLRALEQHADFLEQRPAPPLRAIVPGLVHQHEMRALPGLVEHLFDPETELEDLPMLVSAIDALSGEEGSEPLGRFFSMYRADSALAAEPHALALAAEALIARGDMGSRALLEATRDSPTSPPALREQLTLLLQPPAVASEAPAEVAAAPAAAPPPPELRAVLDAARPAFEPCLTLARARAPKLNSVRVWFVAQPDGSARDVHVMPIDRELGTCMQKKLGELALPREAAKRLISYRVVLPPSAASPAWPVKQREEDGEFWTRAQHAAGNEPKIPAQPAWWVDQNPLFVAIDAPTTAAPRAAEARPVGTPAPVVKPKPAEQAPAAPAAAEDTWWVPAENGKK
ncbi:MAG TPA: PQQ-binding-like beta-propeller repeat protein [Polyangiales bacterium]|nr:PQQ-binding-like beta-propeller repeat protein [Polyangiales bacterium]